MKPQELLKITENNLLKNLEKQQPIIDKSLKQAKDLHAKQKPAIDKLLKDTKKFSLYH